MILISSLDTSKGNNDTQLVICTWTIIVSSICQKSINIHVIIILQPGRCEEWLN